VHAYVRKRYEAKDPSLGKWRKKNEQGAFGEEKLAQWAGVAALVCSIFLQCEHR
jgi:hypothetical protein